MLNGAIGVEDAAEILGCSPFTVYRKVKLGKLKPISDKKIRGLWWFDREYIQGLKDSGEFLGKPGRPPKEK